MDVMPLDIARTDGKAQDKVFVETARHQVDFSALHNVTLQLFIQLVTTLEVTENGKFVNAP